MHPMLNIAIQAARAASRIILRYVDQLDTLTITEKNENDYVTQVDKMSENEIIMHIQKAYPHHHILAEESGKHEQSPSDFCWMIDPLDGTKNFIHGFPHFAISIGLSYKNQMEIGVVYDPIRQDLFTATRGQGAYLNSRRIRVSESKKLNDGLIATGFPVGDHSQLAPFLKTFEAVVPYVSGIRRSGSAALDLAYVAAGRLDGFWEPTLKPWDIAAGSLMVKEAGGKVSDFLNESNYLESGNIVAGNLRIHKELMELIKV